jgi:GT2 family glycosyltransferase
MAIVLTHNAPESLERSVRAIRDQSRPVDDLLVIDNASSPPAIADARILRSDENTGPAGGWAVGVQRFLESDAAAVWLMDDDCEPQPTCLEVLVSELGDREIVYPIRVDRAGERLAQYNAWHGPLLSREVVERIGIPMAELFWWREDAEYLALRPELRGVSVRWVEDAKLVNTPVRRTTTKPVWKFYYETRNIIYYRFYLHRTARGYLKLARTLSSILGVILLREPHKLEKLTMFGRGVVDGLRGRLGATVKAEAYEDVARYR